MPKKSESNKKINVDWMVAITGRSSNLFRATISVLTGRNPAQFTPRELRFPPHSPPSADWQAGKNSLVGMTLRPRVN